MFLSLSRFANLFERAVDPKLWVLADEGFALFGHVFPDLRHLKQLIAVFRRAHLCSEVAALLSVSLIFFGLLHGTDLGRIAQVRNIVRRHGSRRLAFSPHRLGVDGRGVK